MKEMKEMKEIIIILRLKMNIIEWKNIVKVCIENIEKVRIVITPGSSDTDSVATKDFAF